MSDNHTNASDAQLADLLAGVDGGILVSLKTTKKGVERGPAGAKTVYGNDRVHVLIWAGYEYGSLVALSDERLEELEDSGTLIRGLIKEANLKGTDVTVEEATHAVQEVRDLHYKVLQGASNRTGSTDDDDDRQPHWLPLKVGGVKVRGCRVYNGAGGKNPRDPKPGTIYITGIKVGEKVLEPAPHGRWVPQSKPKTVVKGLLERKLPRGRFVQYALPPGSGYELSIGREATEAADADGVKLRAEAVHDVINLASG